MAKRQKRTSRELALWEAVRGTLDDLLPPTLEIADSEYELMQRFEHVREAVMLERPQVRQQLLDDGLQKEFGQGWKAAKKTIEEIVRRQQGAANVAGQRVLLVSATEARKKREIRARVHKLAKRRLPRPTPGEIVRYSAERARVLGFPPAEIWAARPGSRSDTALKEARSRIVSELCEKNATLAAIGAVFGGRDRASMVPIRKAGDALLERDRARDLQRYQEFLSRPDHE